MKRLLRAFLWSVAFTLIAIISISSFWTRPLLLSLILIVISLLVLFIKFNKENFYLYIIIGLTGALSEAVAIAFGAWKYGFPNIIGIPYWLPFIWGLAGLFVKEAVREIHDFVKDPDRKKKVK